MACHLFGAKSLFKPIWLIFELTFGNTNISENIIEKIISQYRSLRDDHFVSASVPKCGSLIHVLAVYVRQWGDLSLSCYKIHEYHDLWWNSAMSNACNRLGLITLYRVFSCLHNTILMKSPSRSSRLPIVLRTRRGVKRRRLASQRPMKIHGGGLSNTANSTHSLRELNIKALHFITPFQQDAIILC